jgi:hypothetical protein
MGFKIKKANTVTQRIRSILGGTYSSWFYREGGCVSEKELLQVPLKGHCGQD